VSSVLYDGYFQMLDSLIKLPLVGMLTPQRAISTCKNHDG
jgi:hypothetical protein